MKWLKKKLRNWLSESDEPEMVSSKGLAITASDHEFDEPLKFTITKANGGTIVSTRRYDRQKDRSVGDIYIVTDDQSLSDEIGRIVTMECLKL